MAETSFIKTVAFGGYDKTETENLFEAMNLQICELQNELRQNKALLEGYKTNPDEKKNIDALLSAERTKLSQMQVQNETLAAKNKDLSSELRDEQLKTRQLQSTIDELQKKLEEADTVKSSVEETEAAAEKLVEEAQGAAKAIKEEARAESEKLKEDTLNLVESVINEANDNAAKIIRDAEARAAKIDTEIQERFSAASIAAADRRDGIIGNIRKLEDEFDRFKLFFVEFQKYADERITASEELLSDTEEAVKNCYDQVEITGAQTDGNAEKIADGSVKSSSIFQKFKEKLYEDAAKETGIDVKTAMDQGVLYVNPPEQPTPNNFLYVNPPEMAVNSADQAENRPDDNSEKPERATVVKVRRRVVGDAEPENIPQPEKPVTVAVTPEITPVKSEIVVEKPSADPEKPAAVTEKPTEPAKKKKSPDKPKPAIGEGDHADDLDMLMAMAEALNED